MAGPLANGGGGRVGDSCCSSSVHNTAHTASHSLVTRTQLEIELEIEIELGLVLHIINRSSLSITEKAPTRAFS